MGSANVLTITNSFIGLHGTDNIKMVLKGEVWKSVMWVHLAQDTDFWQGFTRLRSAVPFIM